MAEYGPELGKAGFRESSDGDDGEDEAGPGTNGLGSSTRGTSAAGTPVPGGNTKLRLNFGAR